MKAIVAILVSFWLLRTGFADEAPPSVNYQEHVRPIFVEHCASCHNLQKNRAGLALDDYGAMMEGGASGVVVVAGDLAGSRLWNLVSHEEEPTMPPDVDRIAGAKLELIRQWIETGALERSGDQPAAAKRSALVLDASQNLKAENIMPGRAVRQPLQGARRVSAVSSIACAPASPLVAIAQPNQVFLYHLQTAELLAVIPCADHTPEQVRFSRDGRYLMVAGGHHGQLGRVVLWDVATCQPLAVVGDELDVARSADLHPRNQWIALGGPQRLLRSYNVATGAQHIENDQHTDWIQSVTFRPQGDVLASGDRAGNIFLWEADSGREIRPVTGHTAAITGIDWRSDGNVLVSSSEDGTIRIWESPSAKQLRSASAHANGATCARFLRDGRVVSAGRDKMVRLWSAELQPLAEFGPMPDVVLCCDGAADQTLIVAGDWQGNVAAWQIESKADGPRFALQPPTLQDRVASFAALQRKQSAELARAARRCNEFRTALQLASKEYDAALNSAKQAGEQLDSLLKLQQNEADAADDPANEGSSAEPKIAEIESRAAAAAETIRELTTRRAELTKQLLIAEPELKSATLAHNQTVTLGEEAKRELVEFQQHRLGLSEAIKRAESQLQVDQSRLAMIEKVKLHFEKVQSTVATAIQDAIDDKQLTDQVKSFHQRTAQALAGYGQQIQDAQLQIERSAQAVVAAQLQLRFFTTAYPKEETDPPP